MSPPAPSPPSAPAAPRPPVVEEAVVVLDRLAGVPDRRAVALALALDEALFGTPPPEEAAWVGRIEALRGRLERDATPVAIGLALPGVRPRARERVRPVGQVCRQRSKRPLWGLLLLKLVRKLSPRVSLELGSCLGISSAYIAAGHELAGRGRLHTLEGAPALAAHAARNLADVGLGPDRARVRAGLFQDTLPPLLDRVAPVDFAFIDGHHDEHATLAYFDQILPHVSPEATLVFDDIAWSPGMASAWAALRADPRTGLAVDLDTVGVCMPGAASPDPRPLALPPLSRIQAAEQVPRILDAACAVLPADATVLVVSRGDEELLALGGRRAWHFPESADGGWAGHHPADSDEAVAGLERMRRRGADHLLLPCTAFWWLEFYDGLRRHLERRARRLMRDDRCAVYALSPPP